MDCKDILMDWLQDAYRMEHTVLQILAGYEIDAVDYDTAYPLIQRQKEQTYSQAQRIKDEIERLGGQVLEFESRDLIGLTSPFQYTAGNMNRDRVVKNVITEHAFEHYNHAAYRAIVKLAEICSEGQIAQICQDIMQEDREMAEEAEKLLPRIVTEFYEKQSGA